MATAESYAQVRDELRRKGRPIPENDVWIAALARQHDQPVVARGFHFAPGAWAAPSRVVDPPLPTPESL
jgi:predicted nucleic acid-binding protein